MNKSFFTAAFILLVFFSSTAKPRLAVVISFDQMRGDYTERWNKNFGNGGFNLLVNNGAYFAQTYFSHANNTTGPGHSILLTGCNPAKTGITGNDFIDSVCNCLRYCAADDTSRIYGVESPIGRSPHLLAVPTLGDALAAEFPKSKTVAVSLKDRAAILMAGRKAKTVLWFDQDVAGFTTSTYYIKPKWLDSFNRRYNCKRFAGWQWQTELPDGASDNVDYEAIFPGGEKLFPHVIPNDKRDKNYISAFLHTPKSIELLFDAAKAAMIEEKLGEDAQPDLLCISVSTTDFIGHLFGPDSREIEELYVHCDRMLAEFIQFLDKRIGRNDYILVVSSDHGVAPFPEIVQQFGKPPIDAGRIAYDAPVKAIKNHFDALYGQRSNGAQWVKYFDPPTIFINEEAMESAGGDLAEGAIEAVKAVKNIPGIAYAATVDDIMSGKTPEGWNDEYTRLTRNDLYPGRSGQVIIYPKQYWLYGSGYTSHGTFYDYDRFVPMIFFGGGIIQQRIEKIADPADIAPTLASILGVSIRNADGIARNEIYKIEKTKSKK